MYKKLNLLKQLMESKNNENFFIVTNDKEKANLIEAIATLEEKQIIRWNVDKNDKYFNALDGTEDELVRLVDYSESLNEEEKFILITSIKIAKRVNEEKACMKDLFHILCNLNDKGRKDYVVALKRKTTIYGKPISEEMQNEIDMMVDWFLNDYYAGIGKPKGCSDTYENNKNLRIKLINWVFNPMFSKVVEANPLASENTIKVLQSTTNLVQIIVFPDDLCMQKYFDVIKKIIDIRFKIVGEKIPFTYYLTDKGLETYPKTISESYMEKVLKVQKEILEKENNSVTQTYDLNEILGEKIRRKRESIGISRENMASILDITPNFLGDVERGKKSLSTQKMLSVCNMLNISLDGIMKNADNMKKKLEYDLSELNISPERMKQVSNANVTQTKQETVQATYVTDGKPKNPMFANSQ